MVLGFKSAKTLTGIQFNHYSGLPLQKFAVDYWSGNAWVECLALREGTQGWFAFTPQVTTTKVRVRLQAGASPVLAEVTDTFVLAELDAPVVEAVAAIRWALVIPISSRPTYSKAYNTPIAFGVADGIIKRGTGIPFYAMSVAGPGGVADILVTKVSGLMTSDTPQPTGFYMQPGNLIEV
jgi:hypothetical protein